MPHALADEKFLLQAIELSKQCPPSSRAFAVGALVVDSTGQILATGYSRESGESLHAEELALEKLSSAHIPDLSNATLYSSLEPCGERLSGKKTCVELIITAGIKRVVYAEDEPNYFVNPSGQEKLISAGIAVIKIPELAQRVREINKNLFSV